MKLEELKRKWNDPDFRNHVYYVALTAVICLAVGVALSGCGGNQAINDKVVDAQIAASKKATLELSCPTSGCVIGSMSYTDPRDRNNIRMPTNGYDVANTLINKTGDIIGGAVVPVVAGKVVIEGYKAVRDSKGASTTTSTTTTTTTTNTASGGSVAGSGTASTDDHSATATPTIVTQPAPVIVTQPAPVIVTPPTP